MRVVRHTDVEAFAAIALPLLGQAEAENNLPLGICAGLRAGPMTVPPLLAIVEEDGRAIAVALMTPPHKLVLPAAPSGALAALCADLADDEVSVPGVVGRADVAEAFATMWRQRTTDDIRLERGLRIYQLTTVVPPRAVSGQCRQAAASDLGVVERWAEAFVTETGLVDEAESIAAMARSAVEGGRLYLWEDGEPASMAARTGPTPNGARVTLVYTPPALRGRGYASACVAALSAQVLASGRTFCFLFTDVANPTSNSIYMKIGYRPVCDVSEYRFQRREAEETRRR